MGEFWAERFRWPGDTAEYVFLARAVDRVGKHLFGDYWRGDEPIIKAPPSPPRPMQEIAAERVKARPLAPSHYTLKDLKTEYGRATQPVLNLEEAKKRTGSDWPVG